MHVQYSLSDVNVPVLALKIGNLLRRKRTEKKPVGNFWKCGGQKDTVTSQGNGKLKIQNPLIEIDKSTDNV
jgi:hypothetical protein